MKTKTTNTTNISDSTSVSEILDALPSSSNSKTLLSLGSSIICDEELVHLQHLISFNIMQLSSLTNRLGSLSSDKSFLHDLNYHLEICINRINIIYHEKNSRAEESDLE